MLVNVQCNDDDHEELEQEEEEEEEMLDDHTGSIRCELRPEPELLHPDP